MASPTTLTILLGFTAAFWCLYPLQSVSTNNTLASQSLLARLAVGASLTAAPATFGLTLLLLAVHVRALGRPDASGCRLPARLAKATLAAAAAALLAGAVLRVVAGGHVGSTDDVGRRNTQ